MKPWTSSEEDAALAIMRSGGSVEQIAEALPHRTARAVGIKAKRLQGVLDFEAKAVATEAQKRSEDITDSEIMAEFDRLREGRTDWITEAVLEEAARVIGVPLNRMRDALLRHVGVIE